MHVSFACQAPFEFLEMVPYESTHAGDSVAPLEFHAKGVQGESLTFERCQSTLGINLAVVCSKAVLTISLESFIFQQYLHSETLLCCMIAIMNL